jgi:hypothetical protein
LLAFDLGVYGSPTVTRKLSVSLLRFHCASAMNIIIRVDISSIFLSIELKHTYFRVLLYIRKGL